MNKELTTTQSNNNYDDAKKRALRYYDFWIGQNNRATDEEKEMFLEYSAANNLNPFKKEIFLVKYGNKCEVLTSYHVYLKRVWASGQLEFMEVRSAYRDPKNSAVMNNLYAQVTIKRKGMEKEAKVFAFIEDYTTGKATWQSKQKLMLEKCAIVRALRLYFSDIVDLPYTKEEAWEEELGTQEPIEIEIKPTAEFDFVSFNPQADKLIQDIKNANPEWKKEHLPQDLPFENKEVDNG